MELQHFSRRHPLMLMEEQGNDGEKKVVCSGCEESVLKCPYYQCPWCDFVLHKSCAELPREMRHPLHPYHPITLQAPRKNNFCVACQKHCGKCFFYRCELCNFNVDIKCASGWQISIDQRLQDKHAFIPLVNKEIQFTCEACGEEGKHIAYICTVCRLLVHHKCTTFPRIVKITRHEHLLFLTYSLQDQVNKSDELFCQLCYKRVNIKYGAYYCTSKSCNYAAHLECGINNKQRMEIFARLTMLKKRIMNTMKLIKERLEGGRVIKHLYHEHELTLSTDHDKELKDDQHCYGCMRPISGSVLFYSCAPCNFFIHKECDDLPYDDVQHPLHNHELFLDWKADSIDGVFVCNLCKHHCHGFTYNSMKLLHHGFNIDLRCYLTPETLIQGHKHPLHLANKTSYEICSACDHPDDIGVFVCIDCNFTLGYRCATLPLVVNHIDHSRLLTLTLTFEVEDDSGEYYCLICEEKRDPNHWFYYSADSNFAAHPQCVLGKYPYIKFGGIYKYHRHPHPLTLVEKAKLHPPCEACHEPFVGLALECAKCKFNIHREGDCFEKQREQGSITYETARICRSMVETEHLAKGVRNGSKRVQAKPLKHKDDFELKVELYRLI